MNFPRHISLLLAAAFMAAATSCSQPDQTESYLRASQKTAGRFYCFPVDMSEEDATYDIFFYTRSDCREKVFSTLPDLAVEVIWASPEGVDYRENVYVPHDSFVKDSGFSHSVRLPYRTGLAPSAKGEWKLSLMVPDEKKFHIRGMGIIVQTNRNED